jgi:hypothetical protein
MSIDLAITWSVLIVTWLILDQYLSGMNVTGAVK